MPRAPRTHFLSDIDPDALTASCAACGPVRLHAFRRPSGAQGFQCYEARRQRRAADPNRWGRGNVAAQRFRNKVRRYGISPEQYDAMLIAQTGRCAICTDPLREPHIDHDHGSGRVRGLLCLSCNTGLGHFRDEPQRLEAALAYLQI